MKDSYLTAGIRFCPLIRLLGRNKLSCHPRTLARVLFLLQSSLWSSLFSKAEAIRYGKQLERHPVPVNPVFIIGHWRTGSTFLHQLMVRDPQLTAPTLFQVAEPDSFLFSYRYYKPIFKSLVASHRPMDMVRLGMNEPQEDEYAIYRITRYSPLEKLVFPDHSGYFLNGLESYLPPEPDQQEWDQEILRFFRKVDFQTGRRIVSKNPFNSFRIPTLLRLFPEARFIHIVRNPLDVIPSTIHMWSIVQRQNCLNRMESRPTIQETCTVMAEMTRRVWNDTATAAPSHYQEIRFEDLEKNPVHALRQLYGALEMTFSEQTEHNILQFLREEKDYRKNAFRLSDQEKSTITETMRDYMIRYGYNSYL